METMDKESARQYQVNSVFKAINIVQFLTDKAPKGFTMAELQQNLGLKKSTLFVLLNTLVSERLITLNEESRLYYPGNRLLEWGSAVGKGNNLQSLAPAFLEKLTAQTRETSHVAVLDSDKIMFIDKVESPEPLKMSTNVGARLPLHYPATAKAIFAYLSPEKQAKLLKTMTFERMTANTITSSHGFMAHIENVKSQGYAIDNEEVYIGTRCAAAPVFNAQGRVVAAIGITAPALRFKQEDIPRMAAIVKEIAADYSKHLRMSFQPAQ